MEQDINSPHKYLSEKVNLEGNEFVFDCGGAEGNFVFLNKEKISKAVTIECDPYWIEALNATFGEDKNIIIEDKIIGKTSEDISISIDDLCIKYGIPTCIKMDIEGSEIDALHGAKDSLLKDIKWFVCTYHRQTDYDDIRNIFIKNGYDTETSKGYMTIHWSWNYKKPFLRRGLIRARRKDN